MKDTIGFIYFELLGIERCWMISAHPTKDTPETLKKHLKKHIPRGKFIGAEVLHFYIEKDNNYVV